MEQLKIDKVAYSIEKIEFELLKEINVKDESKKEKKLNDFNDLVTFWDYTEGIVIHKEGGLTIIKSKDRDYQMSRTSNKLIEGQLLLTKGVGGRYASTLDCVEVDDDIMEYDGKDDLGYHDSDKIVAEILKTDSKITLAGFKAKAKRITEINEAERLRKEKQREIEHKKVKEVEVDFEKEWSNKGEFICKSDYGNPTTTFKGDMLDCTDYSIKIDQPYNRLLSFRDVNGNWGTFSSMDKFTQISKLMEIGVKDIEFVDKHNPEKSAKIHYENFNSTINGVAVAKSNILTIMRNAKDLTKDSSITLYNTLGVTKMNFCGNENMDVEDIQLPVTIVPVSKDKFKLEIADHSRVFDWKQLKSLFNLRHTNTKMTITYPTYKTLMLNDYGIEKSKMFELLRNYKLLGAL
ncbi:hypothetical protein KY320_01540 [Candidatus Woesearchaeota archaeon]|nr:hypothetical protein [Candidatus Woesearchaeota archaeon]